MWDGHQAPYPRQSRPIITFKLSKGIRQIILLDTRAIIGSAFKLTKLCNQQPQPFITGLHSSLSYPSLTSSIIPQ